MADDNALSPQDIQDLQSIASSLPKGDPRLVKIQMLLSSQPLQPPDATAQARQAIQNIPQFTSPTDELRANLANAQSGVGPQGKQFNDYMRQSGAVAATAAGGMVGGAVPLGSQGLPRIIQMLGRASAIGAGTGVGQLANEPTNPTGALETAAGTTAGAMALSPVAKFIQDLAGKAKAGPLFQAVNEAAGQNHIDTSGPLQVANEAKQLQQAGFTMPRVINRFLARMNSGEPMTFEEARRFEQAAGGRLAPGEAQNIRPQMYAKLSQFADQMRKSTMQAAGQAGAGDTFSEALQTARAGYQAQEKVDFMKDAMMELIKRAGQGAALGAGGASGAAVYKAVTKK